MCSLEKYKAKLPTTYWSNSPYIKQNGAQICILVIELPHAE